MQTFIDVQCCQILSDIVDIFFYYLLGGGMYAHTILGIEYNEQTGQVKYLILDPHYTGPDVIKQVIERVSNSVKCIVSFRII